MHRNSFFSQVALVVGVTGRGVEAAVAGVLHAAARGVADGLRAGSPWPFVVFLALGAPWLRIEADWPYGGAVIYPGHWALAALIGLAFLREGRRAVLGGGEPLPLRGLILLLGYVLLLQALRGEWTRLGLLAGATLLNFFWGWAAYQLGRHGERADAAAAALPLWLLMALGVELLAWALAIAWPPACAALNCPVWPEDPPRFRGGFWTPGQFGLAVSLALPALTAVWLAARTAPGPGARAALIGFAAIAGLALLAGGGAWLLPLGLLAWLGLVRAFGPVGDPRDISFLRRLGLWMAVVPVLFYALFPGYLSLWFSLGDPPWSHVRVTPAGPTPRVISSERTTVYLLDVTNESAFPLPAGAAIVPRLLLTPTRGTLLAHDLPPAPIQGGLGGHALAKVAVAVRLPPWVEHGFLSWQVRSPDGRTAVPSGESTVGMRFLNADYRSLADSRENLLSAVSARARSFHEDTFSPEIETPGGVTVEKVIGDILDTLLFSPLWGESKGGVPAGTVLPPNRPFLAQWVAEFGLIGLALLLRLGWMVIRRAELLSGRTTKPAARLSWSLVAPAVLALGALGLFSPAPGSFHGQWGLFLLFGFVEGRYDRLVPPRQAARTAPKGGVRAGIGAFAGRIGQGSRILLRQTIGRALGVLSRVRWPRPRRPGRAAPRRRWR